MSNNNDIIITLGLTSGTLKQLEQTINTLVTQGYNSELEYNCTIDNEIIFNLYAEKIAIDSESLIKGLDTINELFNMEDEFMKGDVLIHFGIMKNNEEKYIYHYMNENNEITKISLMDLI